MQPQSTVPVAVWDRAPLDHEDVQTLLLVGSDERIRYPASRWLAAYSLAHWLGFSDATALAHAGAAWDRAVEDLAIATRTELVELN
jgi:hypothetical protein